MAAASPSTAKALHFRPLQAPSPPTSSAVVSLAARGGAASGWRAAVRVARRYGLRSRHRRRGSRWASGRVPDEVLDPYAAAAGADLHTLVVLMGGMDVGRQTPPSPVAGARLAATRAAGACSPSRAVTLWDDRSAAGPIAHVCARRCRALTTSRLSWRAGASTSTRAATAAGVASAAPATGAKLPHLRV